MLQVDSTLRDELAQAAGDLLAARAEQLVRTGEVLAVLDENARFADALRDLSTALTVEQYATLRMETLHELDRVTRPAAPPEQPSTPR